jgi:hypothetical protein
MKQARDHFDLKAKREAERQKKEAVVNDRVASGLEDVRLMIRSLLLALLALIAPTTVLAYL